METLSFFVGSILIGVAVIGGGFEAKEIKIPRVGAAVRVISLFVGLGFIVLALALFGIVKRRELAADGGLPAGATALSSGPVVGDTTAAAAAVGDGQAIADADMATTDTMTGAASESTEPEFGGFSGRTRVTWTIGGTTYTGEMETDGGSGTLLVSYLDTSGQRQDVQEDLRLENTASGWFYSGSNPRLAVTAEPLTEYQPDFFHIAPSGPGTWTFDRACDHDSCVEVTVEPIS